MNAEIQKVKNRAEEYRALYRAGSVSREIAKVEIMPYIDIFNSKSKEVAKKFKQQPRTISFVKFIR